MVVISVGMVKLVGNVKHVPVESRECPVVGWRMLCLSGPVTSHTSQPYSGKSQSDGTCYDEIRIGDFPYPYDPKRRIRTSSFPSPPHSRLDPYNSDLLLPRDYRYSQSHLSSDRVYRGILLP